MTCVVGEINARTHKPICKYVNKRRARRRTHVGDGAALDGDVRELHMPDRLVVVLEHALPRGDGHVQPVGVVDAQEQLCCAFVCGCGCVFESRQCIWVDG